MSEMEETVEVEFWEAISHERGFDSAGMYHDDTDFQLERISVCCDEPTGDRCVYFAILIDLEQGTMDSVRIGVLPETFLTDSLGACANVSMTTHTLRTSQLFEDFATIDFKDCFEVNDMAELLPLAMARGCYENAVVGVWMYRRRWTRIASKASSPWKSSPTWKRSIRVSTRWFAWPVSERFSFLSSIELADKGLP